MRGLKDEKETGHKNGVGEEHTSIPGKGNSMCKTLELNMSWVCSRTEIKIDVAGV